MNKLEYREKVQCFFVSRFRSETVVLDRFIPHTVKYSKLLFTLILIIEAYRNKNLQFGVSEYLNITLDQSKRGWFQLKSQASEKYVHFYALNSLRSLFFLLHGLLHQCGLTPSYQMKVNFAFHLEINVPESGGRVERHRIHILQHTFQESDIHAENILFFPKFASSVSQQSSKSQEIKALHFTLQV